MDPITLLADVHPQRVDLVVLSLHHTVHIVAGFLKLDQHGGGLGHQGGVLGHQGVVLGLQGVVLGLQGGVFGLETF